MNQRRNRNHEDSSQIHNILNRVQPKSLPKDYHKENIQLMKMKE